MQIIFNQSVYVLYYSMVVEPKADESLISSLVNSHIHGAQLQRHHGNEMAYTLPISEVSSFAGKDDTDLIEPYKNNHWCVAGEVPRGCFLRELKQ